jgi:hypothetical protein
VLWVFVSLGRPNRTAKKVRVELKNLRPIWCAARHSGGIEIKVKGTHTVLRDIDDGELRYVLI